MFGQALDFVAALLASVGGLEQIGRLGRSHRYGHHGLLTARALNNRMLLGHPRFS
jgi:hypothetical protein